MVVVQAVVKGWLVSVRPKHSERRKVAHIYKPTHKQLVHAGLAFLEVDPLDGDALLPWDAEGSLDYGRGPTS